MQTIEIHDAAQRLAITWANTKEELTPEQVCEAYKKFFQVVKELT